MRIRFAVAFWFAVLILICGSPGMVLAQARVANPHGPLEIDCVVCHTEQSWQIDQQPTDFDHSGTGFVLEGLHRHVPCRDCHLETNFAHVGISCADCHADFHKGQLGVDCEECHTPGGWVDRTRMQHDHDATALPRVGAHARVDCDACHDEAISARYVGTPFECVACHRETYDQTTDPDHIQAGFGFDCTVCHSVFANTWGSGDFRHPPNFPLTGGHTALECSACHADGFQGAPLDCYSCHQNRYEMTNDPSHSAAGFPTGCEVCHTTTVWEPSSWDHDVLFPINSGAHRQEWNSCTDCHEVATDYSLFECVHCHEHSNESETNQDHDEVSGYDYLSTACFQCHPRGDH